MNTPATIATATIATTVWTKAAARYAPCMTDGETIYYPQGGIVYAVAITDLVKLAAFDDADAPPMASITRTMSLAEALVGGVPDDISYSRELSPVSLQTPPDTWSHAAGPRENSEVSAEWPHVLHEWIDFCDEIEGD